MDSTVQCDSLLNSPSSAEAEKGNNTGNLPQLICSGERRVELICQRELLDLETPASCSYSRVPVNVTLSLSTPHKTES